MKSVVHVAIVGMLAFAMQANAQQAQLIGQQAMQRMQQSAAAREFLANRLGVRSSSLADANAALAKLSAGERAAILRAIVKYDTKFQPNNAAANDKLASEAFNTAAGADVLKVAAAAQGADSNTAATAAAKKALCGTKITGVEMVVEGSESAADLQDAINAGNLGDFNCGEPLRALKTIEQKRTVGKVAVCMTKKGANINTPRPTRINISADCLAIVTGRSAESAKASAYAIAGVNNPEGCGWLSNGLATAEDVKALQ